MRRESSSDFTAIRFDCLLKRETGGPAGLGILRTDSDRPFFSGTSLRELVYRFRFKTLMLLKLLMLQRRVSYPSLFLD